MSETKNENFSRFVIPNMVTNIFRVCVTALIGLLLVPYYIDELGVAAYGLIPLVTSISSYVLVIADSMNNAYSRYLIIAIQKNDEESANSTYTTAVFGLGKMIAIMTPAIVLISLASPFVFQIGPSSAASVQLLFFMALMSSMLTTFAACYTSVFNASNKLYLFYIIRIVYAFLQVGFIVAFFVIDGATLEAIGISFVLSAVIYTAVIFLISKRIYPFLRVKRHLYSKKLLADMSGLGGWTVVSRLGLLLFLQTSLILVNLYLGSEEEGYFAVVVTMMTMVNTACMSITEILVPIIYSSYSREKMDQLKRITKTAMKFVALVAAFPVAYICIFATQILTVWVGAGFSDHLSAAVSTMILIEVAVCATNAINSIPVLLLKIKTVALATIILGIANVLLGIALMNYTNFGILGAGIAWMITMFVFNLVFYPLFTSKILSVEWYAFVKPQLAGYIALAICLIACYCFTLLYTVPNSWIDVIGTFFAGFCIYCVAMMRFGLKPDEKEIIIAVLPNFMKKAVKKIM